MKDKKLLIGLLCCPFLIILAVALFPRTKVFEYNNHEYIQFTKGVVHSPDCKYCLSKYD